jgi:adenosine deaminase/adenosine deaminase CECR1
MRLLSIFAVVTLSLSGLSTALIVQGEPEINDPLVLEHLRDREKLITLEKTHRQGSFQRLIDPQINL